MKNTRRFLAAVMALAMISAISPVSASARDGEGESVPAGTSLTENGASADTNVKYSVDPSYTVIIPANVTLSDDEDVSEKIYLDTGAPFKLAKGEKLSVKIADVDANNFIVTSKEGGTVNYTVKSGGKALAKGDTAAEFSADNTTEKTLVFPKMGNAATYAGEYTGTLTFTIAVEDSAAAAAAPKYADKVRQCNRRENGDWLISSFYDGTNLNITTITKEEAMALAEYLGGGNIGVVYEPNGATFAREVKANGEISGIYLTAANASGAPLYYVPADGYAPETVAVTGVSLNKDQLTLTEGGAKATLTATAAPDNATDKTVTWTSSDESVVTVSGGVVTSVGTGTATITATAGDATATCTVTVKSVGETITRTISKSDIQADEMQIMLNGGKTFTKDDVTITADRLDEIEGSIMTFGVPGTFSTNLGNFIKIEISSGVFCDSEDMGDGWIVDIYSKSATWTGTPSDSVSFGESIHGDRGDWTITFTIDLNA